MSRAVGSGPITLHIGLNFCSLGKGIYRVHNVLSLWASDQVKTNIVWAKANWAKS